MSKKIGFVGVGRMGANMARRLNECGENVAAVFDVNSEAASELAQEIGATQSNSVKDLAGACDIIFTVVTDDAAMRSIFFTDGESLLDSGEGKVFINCATLSPGIHQEIEKAAQAKGCQSLEACMASSIPQARQGTLYLMLGGDESVYNAQEELLKKLSSSMRYVGTAGRAAQVKALVNMVMNINTAALAEGLGVGEALGLDLNMLVEVFSQTGANSRVLETDSEDMINRDHECYFSSAHASKDSGIAYDLAQSLGIELPLALATKKQYDRLIEMGLGELDKSGVAELTFPDRNGAK